MIESNVGKINIGAIQVLRNAVGGGRVSEFPEKSVTKMYGSALRGGGRVLNFQKNKRYVTFEWPHILILRLSHSP